MKFDWDKIKKHLTTKNILILMALLMFIGTAVRFRSSLYFPDNDWEITKDDSLLLSKEDFIVQKFVAKNDNLSGIQFLFGKSKKKQGGKMTLYVMDESCENTMRESWIDEMPFDSDKTYDLKFSKIKDSGNKTLCLKLTFNPLVGTKSQKVFLTKNDKPENKFLTINHETLEGKSLSMRPIYKASHFGGDITKLNQRLSQYKPWFLKHNYLLFIELCFLILSVSTITAVILML